MPDELILPDIFDYNKAKPRIDALVSSWGTLRDRAAKYRDTRYADLDVDEMRRSGELDPDETFTPQRVIDNNIIREKADAMAFLNSSHRLAYFRCIDNPAQDTRELETQFTKGLTYKGWYQTFDRHFDGAALHGWDSLEVLFDPSKPLGVSFEHLGNDKVFFNKKVGNVQNAPLVVVEMSVTLMQLESYVTNHNFDAEQVEKIKGKYSDKKKDEQCIKLYKNYFKYNNCVYIAWYTKDEQADNWLKLPEKYRCGILKQDQLGNYYEPEVSEYPIFVYIYREDELDEITNKKGRGFFDDPQQEAETAIVSSYVNQSLRAANMYAAPKENDPEGNSKLEEVKLVNGSILPVALTFDKLPAPSSDSLQGIQMLKTLNSQSTGKMAAAVSNRKDARKTAKELDLASNEEVKITSTSLANYSDFLRDVFTFAWKIAQSQALLGTITLLPREVQVQTNPVAGIPAMQGMVRMENDKSVIGLSYDVRAAGDIDVLQKQKQIQDFQTDWPVFQQTPLASKFLEDYVRLRYPLQADTYIRILQAGDPAKQIIMQLLEVLKGSLQPEELKALAPQDRAKLMQIGMQAMQYVQGGQNNESRQVQPTV